MKAGGGRRRLGLVLDAAFEGWTSMDYVGEMLLDTLRREHPELAVSALQPWTPRVFGSWPGPASTMRENADRLIARCLVYPAGIALERPRFDIFHIVDHSYGHVAHLLPPGRTGIYCHDLDALGALTGESSSSAVRRALARSVLQALRRVAVVFHSTEQVRKEIIERGLLDESKLVHAPYGVAPEFVPTGAPDPTLECHFPRGPFLLNVGSGAPRKRLDLLFHAFAALRVDWPDLSLVQQGGSLNPGQEALLDQLHIRGAVVRFAKLPRKSLAQLYRRAKLVVLPSEREGFGLPLLEALACGAPVLVRDLPAFREVGGAAVSYCNAKEFLGWATAIDQNLLGSHSSEAVAVRVERARLFSWSKHAQTILGAYEAWG